MGRKSLARRPGRCTVMAIASSLVTVIALALIQHSEWVKPSGRVATDWHSARSKTAKFLEAKWPAGSICRVKAALSARFNRLAEANLPLAQHLANQRSRESRDDGTSTQAR